MEDSTTIEPRAKRQKKEKVGKSAAFEKLKQLKGSKHKYELSDEIDNVYEVVDEVEYSKRVSKRQYDDWIVDDNGSGYVEDGREIFDDDLDSESIAAATRDKSKIKKRKNLLDNSTSKGNLQLMLNNLQTKKKEDKKLNHDNLLQELMSELDDENLPSSNKKQEKSSNSDIQPKPHYMFTPSAKKAAKQYMETFSTPLSEDIHETSKISEELKSETFEDKVEDSTIEKPSESIFKKIQQALNEEKDSNNKQEDLDTLDSQCIENNQSQEETNKKLNTEEYNTQESLLNDEFDMSQFDLEITKVGSFNESKSKIEEEQLLEGWENMQENICNNTCIGIDVDASNIPLVTNEEGKKVFRFFWWDAYEDPRYKPGIVYLFGKVYCESSSSYVSCCVAVENIERKIYLLPRLKHEDTSKPVTFVDVYQEFNNSVAIDFNLNNFKSRKVSKNYCFDPEIPLQSEYLEVRYSPKFPPLNSSRCGKTFSKIFGTNSSFLEIFLLERKIKGPCWLDVVNPEPVNNPLSWCKFEINCQKTFNISVVQNSNNLPPPPLVVASLNIRTAVNSKMLTNEIVMISCLINNEYYVNKPAPNTLFQQHFCVFTRPGDQIFPLDLHESLQKYTSTKVQKMDSEKSLINYFINQLAKLDPDLIVGHDLVGYQITNLSDRVLSHKLNSFSKFSRVKRSNLPLKKYLEQNLFTGRLVCDIKISAKELIKSRSYDLQTLCHTVLKINENQRVEVEMEDIPKCYQKSSDLLKLITFTMQDNAFILKMMYELNVIPLALQITNIAGNVMSRTLLGGRSERNEFLLLHAFFEKDYIVPDKYALRELKEKTSAEENLGKSSRKKPTYSGGLVLDPKIGFYDNFILLMDFNSLYPSIIQEYNICFTTIPNMNDENNLVLPDQNLPAGILPTEIRKLVESRREVKKLMNNSDITADLRMQYDIRQIALKLTANSMYGCLGFSNSRFFAKNLAALVTLKGREILTNTRDLVQKMTHEVIYGDTDSLMINTNCQDYDQVMKIGLKIKQEVNKLYKQVELDIDGVFKYLLLLKKKKYAAVTLSKSKTGQLITQQEHKGLDLVRRDWSQLASEAGKFILNCIFNVRTSEERIESIHSHLRKLKEDLEANKVPLSLLIITKQLSKDAKMYADKHQLPHVQVALRYNQKGGKQLKAGDTVPYVICEDGTNLPPVQRAYHVEELKNNSDKLKIDVKYYLSQQIHPVVTRLCEPIEGTDAYEIANCLGLDVSSFKKPKDNQTTSIGESLRSKEMTFINAENFTFKCASCKYENVIREKTKYIFLEKCENLDCSFRPVDYVTSIQNQLVRTIRKFITKYYKNELTCEDPSCPNDTVQMPLKFVDKYPVCTVCQSGVMYKKYTEGNLYNQLLFYQHLFDLSKQDKKKLFEAKIEDAYRVLRETVDKYLKSSNFAVINLMELFSELLPNDSNNSKETQTEIEDMISDEEDEEEF